jgi:type I restriction enzyme S subunit
MKSTYDTLKKYIRPIDVRNSEGKEENLLGVTTQKYFMPSIANTVGTDFSKYKVVRKGQFTYVPDTSRRGDRIAIALLQDWDEGLVSNIYTVFEVTDTEKLMPEYLMLWFKRPEFDRYARFKSHGSVREIFDWDELCKVELPVPDIEVQRSIVRAYNTIEGRIKHLRELNDNLEATARAIFVEFFGATSTSDTSSSNEIVELGSFVDFIDGDRGSNYPQQDDFTTEGYCLFLNASNVTAKGFNFDSTAFISKERDELLRKGKLSRNDIVLTSRGTVGNVAFYGKYIQYANIRINSGMLVIRPKSSACPPHFLYALVRSSYMVMAIEQFTSGSAQPQLPIKDLQRVRIPLPTEQVKIREVDRRIEALDDSITLNNNEIQSLRTLSDTLLANLAR